MIDAGAVPAYRRVAGVVHRWVQGEVLAIDVDDEVRVLSGAAAACFWGLTEPSSAAELERRLERLVGGRPPAGVVEESLEVLEAGGLVERVDR